MSTETRAPGAPGEGVSDAQVRLERYAILMTFDDDTKIPSQQLTKQWGVNYQTVNSLVSGAKRMAPDGDLAKTLAAAGYQLAEMPKWFGASAVGTGGAGGAGAPPGEMGGIGVGDAEVAEEVVYTPSTPLPIAQVQPGVYQPPTPTPTPTTAPPAIGAPTSATGGQLSPQQVQLLAQQGITYDQGHNKWVRVVPQGRGQYVETVDPYAALRVLEAAIESERERADMAEGIADDLLDTVKLQTQAILKKVALNPSVFQCYQYVSNVRDPATNKVLFSGDFGDYISWAVVFATRVFYGVEPSFQINLPSIYTQHKRRRSDAEHMAQTTQAPPQMLNHQGNFVGYSSLPQTYRDEEPEEG